MVRHKVRYALFQIHFENDPDLSINDSILYNAIKDSIEVNFGNFGIGSISIKYYNPKTCLGIVRIDRDNARKLIAALTFLTSIKKQAVYVQCLHLSGTIKKVQKKIIEISSRKLKVLLDIKLDKF
jgi:ribonuclease P/MRP protein subunit POP5